MALPRASLNLFGLNLDAAFMRWRDAWREALEWPAFRWLGADIPVFLQAPDGRWQMVAGGRIASTAASTRQPSAKAAVGLLLADEEVLVRELTLPPLSTSDLAAAVEMEVRGSSPFPPEDTVWGWRAQASAGGRRVVVALASRQRILKRFAETTPSFGPTHAEVWVSAGGGVCLRGFGEQTREEAAQRHRRRIMALLGFNLVLMLALIAAPVVQQRGELKQAQAAHDRLGREAQEVLAARERLIRTDEAAAMLAQRQAAAPHALSLLEALTRLLPDGAWLERLELQGQMLRVQGWADNTTALLEAFGSIPGVTEVRMPAPSRRDPRSGKERFTIELTVAVKAP